MWEGVVMVAWVGVHLVSSEQIEGMGLGHEAISCV